jgi:hypothetical protein
MVKCSVKNKAITTFTLMIIVFFSACSEKKIHPIQTNQRDIAAVSIQKDSSEIYVKPYLIKGFEEEDCFVIQGKTKSNPLKRELKNPITVQFSKQ